MWIDDVVENTNSFEFDPLALHCFASLFIGCSQLDRAEISFIQLKSKPPGTKHHTPVTSSAQKLICRDGYSSCPQVRD